MIKAICPYLLENYIECIFKIETLRNSNNTELYYCLDKERKKLHDKILEHAKTNRDDLKFSYALADYVESELHKLRTFKN